LDLSSNVAAPRQQNNGNSFRIDVFQIVNVGLSHIMKLRHSTKYVRLTQPHERGINKARTAPFKLKHTQTHTHTHTLYTLYTNNNSTTIRSTTLHVRCVLVCSWFCCPVVRSMCCWYMLECDLLFQRYVHYCCFIVAPLGALVSLLDLS